MAKRKIFYVFLFIPVFLIIILQSFISANDISEKDYYAKIKEEYRVFALPIPGKLYFAEERVPLHDLEVRERFDRELHVNTYWQSQTLLFFKRAHRWFPVIEPILKEHGVPDDFKYLALIESGFLNVISPAGAAGFWQILEPTGRELGLEIRPEVDERFHVEKATKAACRFLLESYRIFGNWTMAAASYNMGRAGLNRQVAIQRVNNYYDLWLNEETSRYIFRILALKTIFENPKKFGFHFRKSDLYLPFEYTTVKVDTTITDLVAFAHIHNISFKELRMLNPWLRQFTLPNPDRKTYELKILNNSKFDINSVINQNLNNIP